MHGLAQWKNETSLWGQEFGNRSQRVVPSTRFDPRFGEDVCGTTVGTFFLSRSVPWETSLAPCHGRVCLWRHSQRRRGTGWNWFGKTQLFLKVGGLNAWWNSSKSLSSLKNLSEWRANQIEVRDGHDLPKVPRNHLVWTRIHANTVPIRRNRQIIQKQACPKLLAKITASGSSLVCHQKISSGLLSSSTLPGHHSCFV